MSKDLMLDIETFDNKPTSLVLTIGLVWFDFDNPQVEPYDGQHHRLNPEEQKGRTISAATVLWWLRQDKAARESLQSGEYTTIGNVHGAVEGAVKQADRVWAKGPDFDCVILASLFPAIKWPFWKHRDVRTVLDVAGIRDRKFEGTAHNALDDAVNQANALREAVVKLRTK